MLSAGRQTTGDLATAREDNLDTGGSILRPHPPSAPADPSILRIQKKRVQLLSGGKQTTSSKVQTTKQTGSTDVAKERDNVSIAAGEGSSLPGVPSHGEHAAEVPTIPSDEELAVVDILKSVEAATSAGEGEGLQTHAMDGVDQMETSVASVRDPVETGGVWSHDIMDMSGVWSTDVVSDTTYFYLSHPKSASDVKVRVQRPHPHLLYVMYLLSSVQQSLSREESTSRGARLDDDFVSNDDHQKSRQSSDGHNISRLSDVR